MPTYSYICSNCGFQEDIFQKISDKEIIQCPKCNKNTFSRKIGGGDVTLQFKGEGFYCNDYKTKSHKCSNCSCKNKK